jgi:D-tyrosyl-tRNA(Tyr) deacylase
VKAVLQRVREACVEIDGRAVGAIGRGLLVLLGVEAGDGVAAADLLARKTAALRIFEDEAGKMNRSVLEVGGGLLVVSQFTLLADLRKGNRPSFIAAALPDQAEPLYERFCAACARTACRSRPAASAPAWRSGWSTKARSRSGSTARRWAPEPDLPDPPAKRSPWPLSACVRAAPAALEPVRRLLTSRPTNAAAAAGKRR